MPEENDETVISTTREGILSCEGLREALGNLVRVIELDDAPGYIYDAEEAECCGCEGKASIRAEVVHEPDCFQLALELGRNALQPAPEIPPGYSPEAPGRKRWQVANTNWWRCMECGISFQGKKPQRNCSCGKRLWYPADPVARLLRIVIEDERRSAAARECPHCHAVIGEIVP